MNGNFEIYLKQYLRSRPLFLSLLRAKEAFLYSNYLPLTPPVLDFGCGDGYFAKVAFAGNFIDVGLDVKESRINEAKKYQIYKKLVIYDGKVIPYKTNSFSTVVSNSVLEHVADLDQVIGEINRIIKPRGKFLTTVMTKKWEEYLFGTKIFGGFYKKYMRKKQVHINLLTRKQWEEKFKKAGFKIVKVSGHLDKFLSSLLDILHYISLPSLVSYQILGKWVLFPKIADIIYPRKLLIKLMSNNPAPNVSGALFFELEKR